METYADANTLMESLKSIFSYIKDFFEIAGVITITSGSLYAIYVYLKDFLLQKTNAILRYNKFKISLGRSIVCGLELTVVADVISTTINQTYSKLGTLFLLVLIRTLISFFLNKDLESVPEEYRKVV